MSVCAQTEEDSATEEMGAPIRDIYEQKAVSKVVRVLTVLAYLLSVSLAAILLSVYYICVWKSPELPPLNDTAELSARRADSDLVGAGPASDAEIYTAGTCHTPEQSSHLFRLLVRAPAAFSFCLVCLLNSETNVR